MDGIIGRGRGGGTNDRATTDTAVIEVPKRASTRCQLPYRRCLAEKRAETHVLALPRTPQLQSVTMFHLPNSREL